VGRGPVEREREEVLDDYQIGVSQGGLDLGRFQPDRRIHGQTGQEVLSYSCSGDRPDLEAKVAKGHDPFVRFYRHAVGSAQAKGEDGNGANPRTLSVGLAFERPLCVFLWEHGSGLRAGVTALRDEPVIVTV